MSGRRGRAAPKHGKAGKRKHHAHQGDAGERWLDTVQNWPDLATGAPPDGAPRPLPGPGAGGSREATRGEAA